MSEGERLQVLYIALGLDQECLVICCQCHSLCDAILGLGRVEIFLSLLQAEVDNLINED